MVLLMLALWFVIVTHLVGSILTLHERTRVVMWAAAAAATVNTVGDFAMVPVFGINGAAIATICACLVYVIVYVPPSRRLVESRERLSWTITLPLAAGVLPALLTQSWIGVPIGVIGVAVSSFAVLRFTDLLSENDLILIEHIDMPGHLAALVRRLALLRA